MKCSWKGEGEEIQNQSNEFIIYNENETIFSTKEVQIEISPENTKNVFSIAYDHLDERMNQIFCEFMVDFSEVVSEDRKIKFIFELDINQMLSKITVYDKQKELKVESLNFFKKFTKENIKHFEIKERDQMLNDFKILENYEKKNKF